MWKVERTAAVNACNRGQTTYAGLGEENENKEWMEGFRIRTAGDLVPFKKLLAAMVLCVLLDVIYVEAAADYGDLENQINEVLADERLKGAISAVSIRDAHSGEIIFSRFGDTRLKIASSMKLLTGAAALNILGPDYTFETAVLTDGKIRGHILRGNLYIKGKGDPTLTLQDFDELAKELKNLGIHKITGDVKGDDTWYDDGRLSEDMMVSDESYYYGAPVSALTASPDEDYDAGSVMMDITPTKRGKPAIITLFPKTNVVKLVNRTVTVEKEGSEAISAVRKHGGDTIIVEGTIPIEAKPEREWMAVRDPSAYALDLFRQSLEKEGIWIKGRADKDGNPPRKTVVLLTKSSPPLSDIFIPYMKLSNNTIAEMLVKEMGKVVYGEGSWEKGLKAVNDCLPLIGVNPAVMHLRDGSGISHISTVPAGELSKLLVEARKKEWFPVFLQSLPVAGAKDRLIGGTLRRRMGQTAAAANVKAKTGTVTGASSLTGYVTTKGGQELAFAIVFNHFAGENVKDLEDQIAVLLADYE
jgi:D-alanyl-D-alanine carboxypeptidase/D-alanyl-D-alanine-endopeptidase (penicillin-binding protein 4)